MSSTTCIIIIVVYDTNHCIDVRELDLRCYNFYILLVQLTVFTSLVMISSAVTDQVSPDELRQVGGLQVRRTVQQQGQFIVVFPQCFTASVDCGYNISDYIHFAGIDWLSLGRSASNVCKLNVCQLVM